MASSRFIVAQWVSVGCRGDRENSVAYAVVRQVAGPMIGDMPTAGPPDSDADLRAMLEMAIAQTGLDVAARTLILRSVAARPELTVAALDMVRAAACSPEGWAGVARRLADPSPHVRNTPIEVLGRGPGALEALRLRELGAAYDRSVVEEALGWL